MNIDAAFKLFDIRGLYPSIVDERLAFIVGKALTLFKRPKKVLVASDTRETSIPLKNFLIDGLSTGCQEICDLFEVPTPEFYYTLATGDFDLGVMITASHISDDENGFKMANKGGLPFDQGEMQSLKNLVSRMSNDAVVVPKLEATRINKTDDYLADIFSHLSTKEFRSKLVLDVTKSSMVTPVLVAFSRLRANFTLSKSVHTGNPLLAENRIDLAKTISETKADLGIIWDSDGDRVVFLDENGKLIPMGFVLGLLAVEEVKKHHGGKVAVDVRTGLVVRDLVEEAGGTVEVYPAWSQFLKYAIKTDPEIVFGGETSGHFVHPDFYGIDDGLLSAFKFLALWENGEIKEKITQLSKKYFELPEKNFEINFDRSAVILENLTEHFRNQGLRVSVIDGLTVFGSDFKVNIRASLTEPFLRLNLETTGENRAKAVISEIESQLK